MDKERFTIDLKKYGVEENVKNYRTILSKPISEKATNIPLIEFMEVYKDLNSEKQEVVIKYLRQVIEDSLSIFLGLLDGSSNINQEGKFKLIYEEEGEEPYLVNNREEDDLLTLWYEDDED